MSSRNSQLIASFREVMKNFAKNLRGGCLFRVAYFFHFAKSVAKSRDVSRSPREKSRSFFLISRSRSRKVAMFCDVLAKSREVFFILREVYREKSRSFFTTSRSSSRKVAKFFLLREVDREKSRSFFLLREINREKSRESIAKSREVFSYFAMSVAKNREVYTNFAK